VNQFYCRRGFSLSPDRHFDINVDYRGFESYEVNLFGSMLSHMFFSLRSCALLLA